MRTNPFTVSIPNIPFIITVILPFLKQWAADHGYKMPKLSHWDKNVEFAFLEKRHPKFPDTIGQYMPYWCDGGDIVVVAESSWLCTMAHEMAHAIQHYNNPDSFEGIYREETELNEYWDNCFEVEARAAGDMVAHLSPSDPYMFINR